MGLAPEDLRHMPEFTAESFTACGKPQQATVFHHQTPTNEDLYVVQCKREILLGYGHMFAEGFVLDHSDQLRDAEDELMWDYR